MFKMEDDSINEPCTSTGKATPDLLQADNSTTSRFEADSGTYMPSTQVHPKDKEVLDLIEKFHTRRSTQWALQSWNTWNNEKMEENNGQPFFPSFNELCRQSIEVLDDNLSRFVTECKNKEGEHYTQETLRGVIFGLQRFMKTYCASQNIKPIIFVQNNFQFPKYNKALKEKLKILMEVGVTKRSIQAVGITNKEEEHLWDVGIFGCSSAEVLSDTVFFYIVKIFGIASSAALRTMKPDTFNFGENELGKYVEIDTNFAGDLEICNQSSYCHNLALLAPNTTKLRHFCNENNPRTFYKILKYYLEVISHTEGGENCIFLRPKKGIQFCHQSIGCNQLRRKFCKIMKSAGLQGYFTTQALVQSILDNLQVKGYMVRRKYTFIPKHQLEISKLLDPPPGIINTFEVKSQTKAILQLVSPSQAVHLQNQPLPNKGQVQYFYQISQFPIQQNSQSTIPIQPHHTNIYKTVTDSPATMPVCTSSETINISTFQSTDNNPIPVSLQKVKRIHTGNACSQINFEDKSVVENEQKIENIIIKQEPMDHEGECFKIASPKTNQNTAQIKRKHDDLEPYAKGKNTLKSSDKIRVSEKPIGRTELNRSVSGNTSEDSEDEIKEELTGSETHEAELEYSFSNDLNKKITKQEVSLVEEDETMFSFSGTSKMGKSVGDLDINLGDYLPENCTIKPGDINIKRMILSDGGKMVIKLKYKTQ